MSTIQTNPVPGHPLIVPPAPGYFRAKRILRGLRRFQNLIRHKERWAADIGNACPIEDFCSADMPLHERFAFLDREILKAMQIVHRAVNFAGVSTRVIHRHWDSVEQKEVEQGYELILDYPRLPRGTRPQDAYESVMSVLEQAIGVYESRLRQSKWDFINPVVWIAYLIRLPITVLERAGLVSHDKTAEMMLGGYAKFMKYAMSVILVLLALRLGVKMPWKDLFLKLIDLFVK
jgi:hypothetical protein